MLSPTMNTDGLDFCGLVGFWDGGVGLSLTLSGGQFSLFVKAHLVYIWGCNFCIGQILVLSWCPWIKLSMHTFFALLFCFASFVNWQLLFEWMGFGVIDIQVSDVLHFFLEILPSFGLSHGLLLLHSQEWRLSNVLITLLFLLVPLLQSQFHF